MDKDKFFAFYIRIHFYIIIWNNSNNLLTVFFLISHIFGLVLLSYYISTIQYKWVSTNYKPFTVKKSTFKELKKVKRRIPLKIDESPTRLKRIFVCGYVRLSLLASPKSVEWVKVVRKNQDIFWRLNITIVISNNAKFWLRVAVFHMGDSENIITIINNKNKLILSIYICSSRELNRRPLSPRTRILPICYLLRKLSHIQGVI